VSLLTFGRRDAPFDAGMPVPIRHVPGTSGGGPRDVRHWSVGKLYDQHAELRCPMGEEPNVGDRVVLGISHPCTAFDRWRLIYEVDDEDTIVGGIRTFF
jgi:D-serine dehydratase